MAARSGGVDTAVRIVVPSEWAETVGALLMELLGAYEQQDRGSDVILVFYPPSQHQEPREILALLPPELRASPLVTVETADVARDWEEGWKDHFHPIVIGRVRIRPPWEPPLAQGEAAGDDRVAQSAATIRATACAATACTGSAASSEPSGPASVGAELVEVVINPGMGFGTGLHPTTRGALELLQKVEPEGALVDAGTGSGVLTVAAAKLGWGPIFAFDNDPVAIDAATENLERNQVTADLKLDDVGSVPLSHFSNVTILANMTLEPLIILLERLCAGRPQAGAGRPGAGTGSSAPRGGQCTPAGGQGAPAGVADAYHEAGTVRLPRRMIVSGVLAGEQERVLVQFAERCGLIPGARVYETEWVSMELIPEMLPSGAASAATATAAVGRGGVEPAVAGRVDRQAPEG